MTGVRGLGPPPPGGRTPVLVTGVGVLSAAGRGLAALSEAAAHGKASFGEVTRFDVSARRTTRAALLPGEVPLAATLPLARAVLDAIGQVGPLPEGTPVLLALHSDERTGTTARAVAAGVGRLCGAPGVTRVYTGACVAASTAVADAAAMVATGRHERVLVAAGHLVEPGVFAVFDAGRALARDGELRPFSSGRTGTLLADAAVAVLVEAAPAAERRGATALARLAGWGRSGDAHHVCRPEPEGTGLSRAIEAALTRAAVAPAEVGYVNANGTGSTLADLAEARALHRVFGPHTAELPVSSSKSVHGHALEASALLELAVTVGALESGLLPVNAGALGPDPEIGLDLVDGPRAARPGHALSLNSAFGGANTALLLAAV
ncbi:beta-ketoacyl synthase N-terminal-like domain-containing protein [Kitasatospora sp. NPDC051170]|uniref:beta-ketoacyl synthase N-terminal-like domain-containing protein n=1 Tax=Kitasatospora sp. NPDC051170 TaxID=3364056 RepID=UPI0037BA6BAE